MFTIGLLTDSIAHLLRECRQAGTAIRVHLIGEAGTVDGRVMAVAEAHAVIAWGAGSGERTWVYFEDILRVEVAPSPVARVA